MGVTDLGRPLGDSAATPRIGLTRMEKAERRFALFMIAPTVITVFAIMGFPWIYSLWLSLNNMNLLTKKWTFVGIDNYLTVLPQPSFQNAFIRTVWFSAMLVVGATVLGIVMALVLNERFKGRGIMRSVMLMPWAVAPVVVGQLFRLLYSGEYGVLNGFLFQVGLIDKYVPFLADERRSLVMVAIAAIWSSAPLSGLLMLAALQSVPSNLYAAAKMDGANAFQRFVKVTLPWLRPMLLLLIILTTINAVMTFDIIYVLTTGGPGEATTVFSWLGYITYFNFARYGEGAAILYMLSIMCLVLAVAYMKALYGQPQGRQDREIAPVAPADVTAVRHMIVNWGPKAGVKPHVGKPLISPRLMKRLVRIGLYALVIMIALWSLAPFYVLVNTSLSTTKAILSQPPSWFPNPITFESYRTIIYGEEVQGVAAGGVQARAILISAKNSAIVALFATLMNLLLGAPAGYAFARYSRYKFTGYSLWMMMMTRMIPALTLVVPFFVLFKAMGLTDTLIGLIIAFTSLILPLTVWIMKGYFETIPASMERAALVDGCNRFESFRRVVVPVAMPGLMAGGIFCFLIAWNEFLYPLLLTSSLDAQTLSVRISQFIADQRYYNPGLLFAAGVLAVIPPVVIAFVFQRYLLQGMLSGSVKG